MGLDVDFSNRADQRRFGVVMAVAISVLALVHWWRHGVFPQWFFVAAGAFLVMGLAVPQVLKPVFYLWIRFAELLNWIVTHVVLTVTFFLLIVPARAIIALLHKDFLNRHLDKSRETYWEDADEQPREIGPYFRQY